MARPRIDHQPGEVYGLLTLVREVEPGRDGVRWLCRCQCGREKAIHVYLVRHNKIQSCGCLSANGTGDKIDVPAAVVETMRAMRQAGQSLSTVAAATGYSRSVVDRIARQHRFGTQPTAIAVTLTRAEAGKAPLPAFHPLAMAELERAWGVGE
jgi:hypothetical protein